MQKDNYQDFDREIRSILEDAEIKPSRGVWESVAERIDTEDKVPVWGWMRWAGVSLAAVAGLAAVLFIGREHGGDIQGVDIVRTEELTAEVVKVEEPEDNAEPEVRLPVASAPSIERIRPVEDKNEHAVVDAVEKIAYSGSEDVNSVTEKETATVPARRKVYEPEETMPLEWGDDGYDNPFSGRVQLYAQGIVAGNDADFNYSRRGASYAYAVTTPKTGIFELGESYYGIPFTVGLGLRFYLSPRFAIGTGLDYSMVTRTFNGEYVNLEEKIDETGNISHTMHYLGIPVNLYYDFVSADRIRVYVTGGAEAEYCIANRYSLKTSSTFNYSSPAKGLQWSAGAGLGVEFRITKGFGLYFDPGVRYYFNCNQPKSIRTDKPLMVNLDAGFRFDF